MSIASEITRIKNNIVSAYTALSDKGATLPEVQDSANLASCINDIQTSFSVSNFDTIDDIRIDDGVMYANKKTATINTDYNVTFTPEQWKKELVIQLHIKTPSVFSNQWIMSNGSGWNTGIGMTMNSDINCAFWFCLGQSDTSKRKMLAGKTIPQADTEYWVRIYKQNTESFEAPTLLQISTDGINWITDTSVSIENITSDYTTNGAIRFFNLTTGSEYYTGGIYFDKDTFISIDGEKVWCLVKETGGSIPSGGKIITVTNTSSQNVQKGDKVWINGSDIVDFSNKTVDDADIFGNVVITEGIASGFSTGDSYINIGSLNLNTANTWSMETEVTTDDDVTTFQNIFVENRANFNSYLGLADGFFRIAFSTTHDVWFTTVTGTIPVLANSTYKVKVEFTGTAYNLYVNDVLDVSYASTTKLLQWAWNIGGANTNNPVYYSPFLGTINIDKTNVVIDNKSMFPKILVNINEDSLTGIAKNDITVGETGNVSVSI